jgi:hypothetical protein
VWWAGPEHRCQPIGTSTGTVKIPNTVCTCQRPIDWAKTTIGDPPPCPVHHVPVTITYTSIDRHLARQASMRGLRKTD